MREQVAEERVLAIAKGLAEATGADGYTLLMSYPPTERRLPIDELYSEVIDQCHPFSSVISRINDGVDEAKWEMFRFMRIGDDGELGGERWT